MVKYTLQLDSIFRSLADPIRRDILQFVGKDEVTITSLADRYEVSFAAVSKHLMVLERAGLIRKRKDGRKQMITLVPDAMKDADEYLEQYRLMWQSRHDKLEALLKEGE